MKYILTLLLIASVAFFADAQDSKWPKVDKSAMDAEFYPANAAWRNYLSGEARSSQPKVKLLYSRPVKNNRDIFGNLVPYGKVWRLGANEATEITFYQSVGIGDYVLSAGTYSVSAMVNQKDWEVRFSSERGIWGSENMDESMVLAKIKVPTSQAMTSQELLSMTFREINEQTAHLTIQWDKTRVEVPITFNPAVFEEADKSPMDKVAYPDNSRFNNYRKTDEKLTDAKVQVVYSRPYKKDREIFGGLLKTGDVWRIGANQSTEITFYEDVKVGDASLKRGSYVMYAKLNEGSWDIIFSKDLPAWGNANRDESKDVATVNVRTSMAKEALENLSIIFEEKNDKLVHMVIGWDQTRAEMPITFE